MNAGRMVLIACAAIFMASGCAGKYGETTVGGGDGGTQCPPPTVGDLPCPVAEVLQAKCQRCHQDPPLNHAPWPLKSFEDTQQPYGTTGKRRYERMAMVIEPDGVPHMPLGQAPQLTPDELQTLRSWFAACAPPLPEGAL